MRMLPRLQRSLVELMNHQIIHLQADVACGWRYQQQQVLAAASSAWRSSAPAAAPPGSRKCNDYCLSRYAFTGSFLRLAGARGYAQAATAAEAVSSRRRTSASQAYGAEQIQVLEGLAPVRKRPGMYIGSTGPRGLHHLLWEVLDNAVDEVQGGFADAVSVELDLDSQRVTITDNGRGIPTDVHPATGKSALETVLTVLHAGGKFGGGDSGDGSSSGYRMSGGLHGVGISVVNALSQELAVEVVREGVLYRQTYSRGEPTSTLEQQPAPPGAHSSGTKVTFVRDEGVFSPGISLDPDTVVSRLRELAFLNAGATLTLRVVKGGQPLALGGSRAEGRKAAKQAAAAAATDEGAGVGVSVVVDAAAAEAAGSNGNGNGVAAAELQGWQVFCYQDGLKEYVQWLNRDNHALHPPAVLSATTGQLEVSVALQWVSDTFSDTLVGFANSIKTIDGGSHLEGFKAALTRLVNTAAKRNKLVKEADPPLSGDHVREGLSAVISVKVPSPEFEGQTKTRLGNPEVRRQVDQVVTEQLGAWLDAHPAALSAIVSKALTAARAAEAARKARELVRRKSSLSSTTLPGKLADCTSNNREQSEIFIVEGDSAGGSAKQARDRRTQAILPLRGKILNVERKDDAALYKNQEIASLIVALGLGPKGGNGSKKGSRTSSPTATLEEGEVEGEAGAGALVDAGTAAVTDPLKGLRYGKIVLLTDADVDGAHIRTLLLTFLFRYRRELFEQGRVYVAVPPLYRVETGRGQEPRWAYSDAGLQALLADISQGRAPAAAAAPGGQQTGASSKGSKSRRSSKASNASSPAAAADQPDTAVEAAAAPDAGLGEGQMGGGGPAVRGSAAPLPAGVSVTRFKGLGEMMPEQLWSTTLNPETRVLRRLTLEDVAAVSHTFITLMGDKVEPRRALIEAEGQKYTLDQLDI